MRAEERKKGKEKKDGCREGLRQQKMATLKRRERTEKEEGGWKEEAGEHRLNKAVNG